MSSRPNTRSSANPTTNLPPSNAPASGGAAAADSEDPLVLDLRYHSESRPTDATGGDSDPGSDDGSSSNEDSRPPRRSQDTRDHTMADAQPSFETRVTAAMQQMNFAKALNYVKMYDGVQGPESFIREIDALLTANRVQHGIHDEHIFDHLLALALFIRTQGDPRVVLEQKYCDGETFKGKLPESVTSKEIIQVLKSNHNPCEMRQLLNRMMGMHELDPRKQGITSYNKRFREEMHKMPKDHSEFLFLTLLTAYLDNAAPELINHILNQVTDNDLKKYPDDFEKVLKAAAIYNPPSGSYSQAAKRYRSDGAGPSEYRRYDNRSGQSGYSKPNQSGNRHRSFNAVVQETHEEAKKRTEDLHRKKQLKAIKLKNNSMYYPDTLHGEMTDNLKTFLIENGMCFYCRCQGHTAADCPLKGKGPKN